MNVSKIESRVNFLTWRKFNLMEALIFDLFLFSSWKKFSKKKKIVIVNDEIKSISFKMFFVDAQNKRNIYKKNWFRENLIWRMTKKKKIVPENCRNQNCKNRQIRLNIFPQKCFSLKGNNNKKNTTTIVIFKISHIKSTYQRPW